MKKIFFTLALISSTAIAHAQSCPVAEYGPATISSPTVSFCHTNYLSQFSVSNKIPLVVNWTLTKDELDNCNHRDGSFERDPMANGEDASPSDYIRTGYDRGHMSPAEDNLFDPDAEKESFYMTNMTPQAPQLNRNGWKWFEEETRLYAEQYGEVIVWDGVVLTTNTFKNGVRVPDFLWKVVYVPKTNKAISILVPNETVSGKMILRYQTSVSHIESVAGVTLPIPSSYDKSQQSNVFDLTTTRKSIVDSKTCTSPE